MPTLEKKFVQYFGSQSSIETFFAPGRVNLIGEHIDYNGGLVLPAALTIGITALVSKNSSQFIRMKSVNLSGEVKIDVTKEIEYDVNDGWGNYPKGVFRYLLNAGVPLVGCDILFSSNLPDGAGLSSSAALEVVCAYLMMKLSDAETISKVELAKLCQMVENKFVGVNCGIMDQFSVAMGKRDHAILLDCNTLNYQYVPFILKGYSLVIMNTNKRRELADSKYNERRSECDKALKIINKLERINNLCQATMEQVDFYLKNQIVLRKRARHVVSENLRVMESVNLLSAGKIQSFGSLLNSSHESLRSDYEVTGKELDVMVAEAQLATGCVGARMTGAGFGGCAIAIVESSYLESFQERVKREYYAKTNLIASFYESALGDGVGQITTFQSFDF